MNVSGARAAGVGAALTAGIEQVAEEIGGLLRSGADTDARIPGARWSVGEAAAHLVQANELMADLAAGRERPYGDGTPEGLAAANAAWLAEFAERDADVLADGIVRGAGAFTAASAGRAEGEPVLTPMGPMDLGTLGSYLLTHMLGHGYDIARALRRPHMVDAERVALALPFLMTAMPRVVDSRAAAGHNACYSLRVRGGGGFAVTFTDGTAAVGAEPPRRPDCTIMTEPVTFLLIALGRCGATEALVRGKVVSWGRKPWLAPRFPGLFTAP
jgi:uncharacterized protein (TIGR03083 family)